MRLLTDTAALLQQERRRTYALRIVSDYSEDSAPYHRLTWQIDLS